MQSPGLFRINSPGNHMLRLKTVAFERLKADEPRVAKQAGWPGLFCTRQEWKDRSPWLT